MGIKQKFFTLAGFVGIMMAIVSGIGYYFAYDNLHTSIEAEIMATIEGGSNKLEGWLDTKKQIAVSAADLLHRQDDGSKSPEELRGLLAVAGEDATSVSDLVVGNSAGVCIGYRAGNLTPKLDPLKMRFYNEPREAKAVVFMDTYVDKITGKQVVSIAAPYNDAQGNYRGAVCEDIFLDILQDEVSQLRYQGAGSGYIFDNNGVVIAADVKDDFGKAAADMPEFKDKYQAMVSQGKGYVTLEKDGKTQIFAYATVPSTKWVMGIMVPESVVFSQMQTLKVVYAILTILSILLIVFACLRFSKGITYNILRLKAHAAELAGGNLAVDDLTVESTDELGELTLGFNTMKKQIHDLIRKMMSTAEQVAASSEQLTASAQQSAEASTHVAETVNGVANGMQAQMGHVETADESVRQSVSDIAGVVSRTEEVAEMSAVTSQAAQRGQELMEKAIERMGRIEESVNSSAKVVTTLGDSSTQIGEIVETISEIANQTNLLALNAAIEAARAGEQGRGFSVVADEVRKLAEQSQRSTEEIRERIVTIQQDTHEAVEAMQNGTGEVQSGAVAIREVGKEFANIMERVNAIQAHMADINAAVQAVSNGGTRITSAVDSINDVSRKTAEQTEAISAATEEQSASTEEIAAASNALAQLAADMQEAAKKFRV